MEAEFILNLFIFFYVAAAFVLTSLLLEELAFNKLSVAFCAAAMLTLVLALFYIFATGWGAF